MRSAISAPLSLALGTISAYLVHEGFADLGVRNGWTTLASVMALLVVYCTVVRAITEKEEEEA